MTENTKFKNILQKSDKSIYTLSHETGIPYTTLNELYRGKTNINKCSAETVYTLATYFGCDCYDLLNDFIFVKGIKGTYQGIKYQWIENDKHLVDFHVYDEGEDIVLCKDLQYKYPGDYQQYKATIETLVEYYLEEKEKEHILNEYI